MGIDAVAVLRIAPSRLHAELAPAPNAPTALPDLLFAGKNGIPVRVRPLADAVSIVTGAPFATPGDELALLVRQLLGPLVDEHRDPRGIFVVPDVAARGPSTETYEALVERVGDAGEWTRVVPDGYVPERLRNAPAGSLDAALGEIMGALDPALVQQMTRAVFSGDPQAFADAQSNLEKALPQIGGVGGMGGLEDAVKKLMGNVPNAPLPGQVPVMPAMPDLSSDEFQAALKKAQEMMAENPDLEALLGELQGKLPK
ncbi:hypothetical protein LZC95_14555 [Pendulispora brunnea]|uniref:Uncharacterized protein n=1 Tax=Pendulispora brunnea TaxID=2905690 RepID=A0ABZ2KM52_9BACT